MDNQHRKIKGYRELSEADITLINNIKETGAHLLELQARLVAKLSLEHAAKEAASLMGGTSADIGAEAEDELCRFLAAEPMRWAEIGKTDIQTGIMALVRAAAQPAGV